MGDGRPGAPAKAAPVAADPLRQFLDSVPRSLVGPFGDDGKVIAVIIIAVAFGVALRRLRTHQVRTVDDLVHVALTSLVIILHWIIDVIPLAVFGIVASIVGVKGFSDFVALGGFVVAVIVALLLQAYYCAAHRLGSWVRPLHVVGGMRDALVMAFSTGSSTATMPVTYACLREKVGLREQSASLGALVGANFNNDGTALYEAMSALFVAQLLGTASDARPAVDGRADLGRRLGRRGRHSRGRPRHHDAGLQRRGAADGVHRHAADGGLVPRPLPHGDQRDGRRERELPARRQDPGTCGSSARAGARLAAPVIAELLYCFALLGMALG